MGFKFPYGNEQQLNLNWFLKKFKELVSEWTTAQEEINAAVQSVNNKVDKHSSEHAFLYGGVGDTQFYPQLPLPLIYGGTGATNPENARNTLGITPLINGKVDKRETSGNFLYAHVDNVQTEKPYQSYPTASNIAMFTQRGTLQSFTPSDDLEVANKSYVDNAIKAGIVTPEEYGAVGDGISDDSIPIKKALETGRVVYCKNTYKVGQNIQISNIDNVTLIGGKFIFDNGGSNNFIYLVDCKKIFFGYLSVTCTDGGFTDEDFSVGCFLSVYRAESVTVTNILADNINTILRTNYSITNDNTQYFLEAVQISNIIAHDCICPFLIAFTRQATITNFYSDSPAQKTRELVYIIGGIRSLNFNNMVAAYASRFFIHFNNTGGEVTVDNTLVQNHVEHFTLTNSYFDTIQGCIVSPVCPIDHAELVNVVSLTPAFRSYNDPSFLLDYIKIDNCYVGAPYIDGVAGKVNNADFINTTFIGAVEQGSANNPINMTLSSCTVKSDFLGYGALINIYGDRLVITNCVIDCTEERLGQGIRLNRGELVMMNNIIHFAGINRFVYNGSTSVIVILINNLFYSNAYGVMLQNTPIEGIARNNFINNTVQAEITNKVSISALSANPSTMTLRVGETGLVKPVYNPANVTNKNITFQNSATAIVTATKTMADGNPAVEVKALAVGTANITIRSSDNSSITAVCAVTVTE